MSSNRSGPPIGAAALGLCLAMTAALSLPRPAMASPAAGAVQVTPRFVVLPPRHAELARSAGGLTTWNFSYSSGGSTYNDTFVGNAPSGAATTTPTFIIPIRLVVSGQTFSLSTAQPNGKSALTDTVLSPLFTSRVSFVQAGVHLGRTQYIDAFQRESFWPSVKANPAYHVLLGAPTVLPTVRITVPPAYGSVAGAFGGAIALVDIDYFDAQLMAILAANPQITAASVPIFETYDTYLTQNGGSVCCIGGYHSATGAQTYMEFSYVGAPGAFAQDVSALSHELGEWVDDPFLVNASPCGIYETGDPLEGDANYGDYPYVSGTMTYNLQDLAQPPYFGAPPSTSLRGRATFQGAVLSPCQNGS